MTILFTFLLSFIVPDVVPQPVYAADTSLVSLYYKAWDMAKDHIRYDEAVDAVGIDSLAGLLVSFVTEFVPDNNVELLFGHGNISFA